MNDNLTQLKTQLVPHRERLLRHPIYELITEPIHVRTFMSQHVFAVWDFMSLLKSLQQIFCGCEIPWQPEQKHPLAVRLINEIVLAEESDIGPQGDFLSHFQLYRKAMVQSGASTDDIDSLLAGLKAGRTLKEVLGSLDLPTHLRSFVGSTFEAIHNSTPVQLASIFLFGREDLIPDLFRGLVQQLNQTQPGRYTWFEYYLERHIEIDDDHHGPMGEELLCLLCGTDEQQWAAAGHAAKSTLAKRLDLWDGILKSL